MSKLKELLIVADKQMAQVRECYNKSEADIQQAVVILKEWLRQQPHLPNDEDEGRLERMFLKNKCRLEQTKRKLDNCYSFKVLYPEMLEMYDINSDKIQNAIKSMIYVPLPKLTDKHERVIIFKMIDAKTFHGFDAVLYMLMMVEFCNTFDYSLSDILIIDWTDFSFSAMKTLEPSAMHKFGKISMGALSARFSNVQYINNPTFITYFLQVAKSAMLPKFFNKIKCTSTIEGVPKKILPIEYGGEEKSIHILHEEWTKELQYHSDLLISIANRMSNERMRIDHINESDFFGTDGSFRKINLD